MYLKGIEQELAKGKRLQIHPEERKTMHAFLHKKPSTVAEESGVSSRSNIALQILDLQYKDTSLILPAPLEDHFAQWVGKGNKVYADKSEEGFRMIACSYRFRPKMIVTTPSLELCYHVMNSRLERHLS